MNAPHGDQLAAFSNKSVQLGKQQLALQVLRWLRENCGEIPAKARDELLTILGVNK